MSSAGSVTPGIGQLKQGDAAAAEKLWQRYFQQLVGLARAKLRHARRGMADEEDAALSAFDTFCRRAREDKFPELSDRDNLWPLLVKITARKALNMIQHEGRKKRGGGEPGGRPVVFPADEAWIEQMIGSEPTPEFAAQTVEEFQHLLDRLPNDELRSVALGQMEGYSNDEIAQKLGCAARTIVRRLQVIGSLWSQEACDE